jgi:T-complex protein 1 subunit theta
MFRNIEACQQLSQMTRSALGPHGMNKMVINHLDRLFVTSDAATIIKESDIHHPAAKMIAMAAHMQENECGDGSNFVISLSGELMA